MLWMKDGLTNVEAADHLSPANTGRILVRAFRDLIFLCLEGRIVYVDGLLSEVMRDINAQMRIRENKVIFRR